MGIFIWPFVIIRILNAHLRIIKFQKSQDCLYTKLELTPLILLKRINNLLNYFSRFRLVLDG